MDSIGVRIQNLSPKWRTLVIARIAQDRGDGRINVIAVSGLFDDFGLPAPPKVSGTLGALVKDGMLVKSGSYASATYRLTPKGRAKATELADDMDIAALLAETTTAGVASLGSAGHPVIPPSLAPPELIGPLHGFLQQFPFDTNVFGMTRFPDEKDEPDPVASAVEAARKVCGEHGLRFHLASDRQIMDDLWANVAAHVWGCKYGVAFFEDRRDRGMNYNLTIEVGSMIVLGRRVAVLQDRTITQLPTDLTGRIAKPVDLDKPASVRKELAGWIKDDLAL